MAIIQPHKNSYLIGHNDAEQMFLNAWKSNSLHSSWLISGPKGVGKATLVYRIARFLLSADENMKESYNSLDVAENNAIFRLVSSNSHPDLKVMECDFIDADKKKIIKAIKDGNALDDNELQDLKKSSVIKVDEVRTINEFMSKKSFDGNWRIVIIDSIDDLNSSSANAILKVLEEPPLKSILLLVSHNPNRLLATIRSRCAKLNLLPLADDEVASLLRRYSPELSEADVKGVAKISMGSIGRALNYVENDGLIMYQRLESLFYAKENFDIPAALALCDDVARDEMAWDLVSELIFKFISENIKSGDRVEELGSAWDKTTKLFNDAAALNMDKKQILLNIILTICKAL